MLYDVFCENANGMSHLLVSGDKLPELVASLTTTEGLTKLTVYLQRSSNNGDSQ